jgi:hypothetical protein
MNYQLFVLLSDKLILILTDYLILISLLTFIYYLLLPLLIFTQMFIDFPTFIIFYNYNYIMYLFYSIYIMDLFIK